MATKTTRFVLCVLAAGIAVASQKPGPEAGPVFEPNQGQAPPDVRFLARGPGFSMWLGAGGAHFRTGDHAWRVLLDGANPSAAAAGEDRLGSTTNYLVGADRTQWRTGIANYAKARFRGVYPGVDLVYYGSAGQLEYDFLVAPGADASLIQLHVEGAGTRIDTAGNLVLTLPEGEIRHCKPVAYQSIGGEQRGVEAAWRELGSGQFGFATGEYDRGYPLVIDPVLQFSTFFGGRIREEAKALATDRDGNIYMLGSATSPDFPASNTALQNRVIGGVDLFVAKFNATGTQVIYSTVVGGSSDEVSNSMAVDGAGNVFVGGTTSSENFPTTPGSYKVFPLGSTDGFVFKLNATGTDLIFSTRFGGRGSDTLNGVAFDSGGNFYITGDTNSTDFPIVEEDAFQPLMKGTTDAYVAKLSPDGRRLIWSTFLGGDNDGTIVGFETGRAIAVDRSGQAWVAGVTTLRDFPRTGGSDILHLGQTDVFLTKFNSDGRGIGFSMLLGGEGVDTVNGIFLEPTGTNIYLVGETNSLRYPVTPSAAQSAFNGTDAPSQDGFLTKVNASSQIVYSTFVGGSGDDALNAVVADAAGVATVYGTTSSLNLPTTIGSIQAGLNFGTTGQPFDTFLITVNPIGTQFTFATYLGGRRNDLAAAITRDAQGNLYVAGFTQSPDFPRTPGALQSTTGFGTSTAFLARIGEDRPGPSTLSIVSGNDQEADEGTALPAPLVVALRDVFRNPQTRLPVQFRSSDGVILSAPQAETDQNGEARVLATLPARPGTHTVTARFVDLAPVTFTLRARRIGPPLPEISATEGVIGAGRSTPPVRLLAPNGRALVRGANFIVPGTDVEAIPDNLVEGKVPVRLGGVCVTVGGIAVRILSVTPNEILFQVPEFDPLGETDLVVITNCGRLGELRSDPRRVTVRDAAPEFLYWSLSPDGRHPIQSLRADTGEPISPGGASANPASVVRAFGVGFGRTNPLVGSGEFPTEPAPTILRPVVVFDGEELSADHVIASSVLPGFPGIYYVDFRIPANARNGNIPVALRMGLEASPQGFLRVTGGEDRNPRLSTSPTQVDFGDVILGQRPERPITIANAGTAPVTVTALVLASPLFRLNPNFGFRLMPGETRVITISFAPSATGNVNATLRIGTDDPLTPEVAVPILANVIEPPAIPNPRPVISKLTPSAVDQRGAGFSIVVDGQNFLRSSIVEVDGQPRSTFFNHPLQLLAFVRASDIVSAGTRQITVSTPQPGGGRSEPLPLTVREVIEENRPLSLINQLYLRFCPRVTSFVSVLDSGGIPVKNLTADRLTCREDNQPVECTIVPAPAEANVSMTIILGLNGLTLEEDVALLKNAARSLVNSLNPGDRIAIVHLEDQARPLLQFTADTARALDLIDQLRPVGAGNALYDSVLFTSGAYRTSPAEDGNRHIVVLLTALDNLSGTFDLPQAIGTARSSGATFYTAAVGAGTNDVSLTGFLRQLSRETFGQFFSEPSGLQFARLAGRLTQLIQGQYAVTTNSLFVDFRQKPLSFTFQIPEGTVTATRTYIPCNP